MSLSLLIVASPLERAESLAGQLASGEFAVRTATSLNEGRINIAENTPDLVLVVEAIEGESGLNVARLLLEDDPELLLVVRAEETASEQAEEATPAPLADDDAPVPDSIVLISPATSLAQLRTILRRLGDYARLRQEVGLLRAATYSPAFEAPLPAGAEMLLDLAAGSASAPVLLVGEPGTGKSQVAALLHDRSSRREKPLLQLRCSTLAQRSIERQLFGSERGASGGKQSVARRGLLEIADGGTVIIDAINALPYETQALLLRFIEEGTFNRVGGTALRHADVRIVASSNRPLAPAVDAGLFRADLFYRLQVLTIALPPLRDRVEELESLVRHLLPPGVRLSPAALIALQEHSWPGNIRELSNALWRATLMSGGGSIEAFHLPITAVLDAATLAEGHGSRPPSKTPPLGLAELEKRTILAALERTGGNKLRAAELLGIARSTLHDKLKRMDS